MDPRILQNSPFLFPASVAVTKDADTTTPPLVGNPMAPVGIRTPWSAAQR
jgi:hypothetical protein